MENTVRLRAAHPIAMGMDNVRLTMHWNGSVCAILVGTAQDVIFIWNKTALIARIMMTVSLIQLQIGRHAIRYQSVYDLQGKTVIWHFISLVC